MEENINEEKIVVESANSANIIWSGEGIWDLYEFIVPTCFTDSIGATFKKVQAPDGGNVLDIGCGSGLSLKVNYDWIKNGGNMTCVDPDEAALAYTVKRAKALGVQNNINLAQLRAQDVDKIGEKVFDGAMAHFSLYTISEADQRKLAVCSAFKVLKPGAWFACTVPAEGYNRISLVKHARSVEMKRRDAGLIERLKRVTINYSKLKKNNIVLDDLFEKEVFHRYKNGELMNHFLEAGFEDVEVKHIDGFNAYFGFGRRPLE